ncbi:MAG: methyltransferase domain-containing protein [Oligoflexia bacterium]|nr:methyltransferase domain-containing protein [Oligoflexia bacterium]
MKKDDLVFFCCPQCKSELDLPTPSTVKCLSCGQTYPIIDHVICFYTPHNEINDKIIKTNHNWSLQFGKFFPVTLSLLENNYGFYGRNAFYKFSGLDSNTFTNKIIGIFCGGSGREAYHVCQASSQKVIVLDIGEHIFTLPNLLRNFMDKLILVRCDLSKSPIKKSSLDIAICDHALQHIPHQKTIFQEIFSTVKATGIFSCCVYSFENNFIMVYIIEPLKKVLSFMPPHGLFLLAIFPALALYLLTMILIIPLSKLFPSISHLIPFKDQLSEWWAHGFKKFWEACFDLLHAPISYHFKHAEMVEMANTTNAEVTKLINTNSSLWTMVVVPKNVTND